MLGGHQAQWVGGVVGEELDGNEIRFTGTDAHNIADNSVDEVVGVASGTPDHMEGASRETFQHARRVQVNRMLNVVRDVSILPKSEQIKSPCLTGLPRAKAGP